MSVSNDVPGTKTNGKKRPANERGASASLSGRHGETAWSINGQHIAYRHSAYRARRARRAGTECAVERFELRQNIHQAATQGTRTAKSAYVLCTVTYITGGTFRVNVICYTFDTESHHWARSKPPPRLWVRVPEATEVLHAHFATRKSLGT